MRSHRNLWFVVMTLFVSATAAAQSMPAAGTRPAQIGAPGPFGQSAADLPKWWEPSPSTPQPNTGGESRDWVRHSDPLGFVLRYPRGWKVKVVAGRQILVQSGDRTQSVLIWPFLVPRGGTAEQQLRQATKTFADLLPQSRIVKSEQCKKKPDEAIASVAFKGDGEPGQATLLCSIYGRSGMLFGIAAPQEQFAAARPTLMRILASFSVTDPTAPIPQGRAARPTLQYGKWQDPNENAFSLEVPSGWNIAGGLTRKAPLDTRPAVQIVSPDGQIQITCGDAAIPTFCLPLPPPSSNYFPEGSDYNAGYGLVWKVRRYVPGAAFAKEYVQSRYGRGLSDLNFSDQRDRPDAARGMKAILAKMAQATGGMMDIQLTTGEVAFTGSRQGQPVRGYYFAGTTRYVNNASQGIGLWHVDQLFGFVAAADKLDVAQEALNHVVQTYRVDPAWSARQSKVAMDTSRIVAETQEYISKIISDTYWSRQAVLDRTNRNWSNAILGLTDLVDPDTGETFKVASGHNYYWRRQGTNEIVGTDTYDRPDIDFAPMKEY